jgi:hypothetical protein
MEVRTQGKGTGRRQVKAEKSKAASPIRNPICGFPYYKFTEDALRIDE